MNFPSLPRLVLVAASLLALAPFARANNSTPPATPAPADATASYPLNTCVVSDEKLGEMGKPYDYVYKKDGQPDRLVRFCCKGCLPDFKKDPEKYLKRLDEAAAAKKS